MSYKPTGSAIKIHEDQPQSNISVGKIDPEKVAVGIRAELSIHMTYHSSDCYSTGIISWPQENINATDVKT